MEKKKTNSSYLYLIIGAIGMLLLVFGLLEYISFVGSTTTPSFLLTFAGFLILVHYIYYLEKKSGISNKVIWVKSGLLALSLLIFTYTFY
ncbi:hypothetical protein BBI08_01825 [Planococcus halocryophilus]|uniref:Uncharacterized protein n=1 Tax=Planococcus halocryophilus TaxID=1215089 RepID=A0A1C7DMJ0_9BACL|nr:hypothetical protein BBI08_01825 [Planococcus halocryophilus]